MSIPIKFLTAAIKKSAIRRDYRGGLAAFRKNHPNALEDHYLVGIVSMSGGELQEVLERIGDHGIRLLESCAVGDQFIGPIERHPHFAFDVCGNGPSDGWQVRLIDDEPTVLAEDGAALLRHFIRMGWAFDLAEDAS